MRRLMVAAVVVLACAGCDLTPNDGQVHISTPTSVTRGGVHVEVCPPYCGRGWGHR